jgi:hypothetical protein
MRFLGIHHFIPLHPSPIGLIFCISLQIVVPPLPGKALKRQLPFRGDEGIFEESFIEERRQGLEQFINK